MSDNANCKFAKCFPRKEGNAVTSRAELVIIYGDKYAAVYYREGERPYIMKTTGLDFQQCSAFTEHAVFNYLCRVANERIFMPVVITEISMRISLGR